MAYYPLDNHGSLRGGIRFGFLVDRSSCFLLGLFLIYKLGLLRLLQAIGSFGAHYINIL